MRKIGMFLIALVLILAMSITAFAATGVSGMNSFATVSSDGSCNINLTVTLHLEQAQDKLYFPIPAEATGVTLNGSRVNAPKSGDVRRINLSKATKNVVGDVSVSIQYSLYNVIYPTEEGTLEMRIPLLSGFEYPVENLNFSVTMPGAVNVLPSFNSGYHQARIEESLTYSVDGVTISGNSLQPMKDHETLSMIMLVSEEMFPQTLAQAKDYRFAFWGIGICAAVALLYWLITMFNPPVLFPARCTEPPQGVTAGHLGCIAAGQGVDLSLAVLTWAQLGYILIKVEKSRVLLYKRMDMGNERSETELRLFKKLFHRRSTVDTSGFHYASLCRAAAKKPAGMTEMMKRFTGTPYLFRAIASVIGLFGGAGLAVALADGAALQGFLIFLFSTIGLFCGWHLQNAGRRILLGDVRKAVPALLYCGALLLLSLLIKAFSVVFWTELSLLLAGFLLAWGGRRTELGRHTLFQIAGLRKYLRRVDKYELQTLCDSDPDYFFRLAPYAIALGADKAFAKRFGSKRLSGCPYLTSGMDGHLTALQWQEMLKKTLAAMDNRATKLPFEKILGMIRSVIKP